MAQGSYPGVNSSASDLPMGALGYAEVLTNQSGISTVTDLTGLSVAVEVAADRRIKVTGRGGISQQTANGVHRGRIQEGASALTDWAWGDLQTGERTHQMGSVILTPSEGAHTYKLTLETSGGTCTLLSSSDRPSFILVEDIGPA